MNYQPMHYVYKPSGIEGARTLLLLHGTGGNEHDLLSLADFFPKELNVLSLRGNVLENGMPRFFRRIGMGVFDEKDLEFRTREMMAFLRQLSETENFDIEKMIALGYSNGANIAGSALFLEPDFFAGAMLLRPMLPYKTIRPQANPNGKPVFMSSGNQDPTVELHDIYTYAEILKHSGFAVESKILPAGHNLTRSDLELAAAWFAYYFG